MGSNVLDTMFGFEASAGEIHEQRKEFSIDPARWSAQRFGEEQIRSLVHQVFFSGGNKTPHQVVFSGADRSSNVSEICLQVGRCLAAQISGDVCIVETAHSGSAAQEFSGTDTQSGNEQQKYRSLREGAVFLSQGLWLLPSSVFLRHQTSLSASWLRCRLDELRLDFNYTIFDSAPAGEFTDAPLLGHLCDGIILVLAANSTHRVAARKVKDRLFSANARLLGTVLSGRKFPIPEALYRRL